MTPSPTESSARQASVPIVTAVGLFILSGACGLAYEVVWSRELVLVFGASALASSATLAGFMGGLGAGGIVAGRRADTLSRPLLVYGVLEIVIGILGALSADFFRVAVRGAFRLLVDGAGIEGDIGRDLARLGLTLVAIFPAAFLMGATFPVMAAAVTRGTPGPTRGRRIATIYAANLVGAVAGTFGAGIFILPALGVRGTLWLTALANVGAGAFAIWLARQAAQPATAPASNAASKAETAAETAPEATVPETEAEPPVESAPVSVLSAIAFAGGARSLALQVVWARVLGLVLGSSVYAITTVLGTILAGLGLGAAVAAPILARTRRPLLVLAVTETLALLAVLATGVAFPELPWLFLVAFRGVADPAADGTLLTVQLGLSALVVLGPAFLMGLSTPLLMGAASRADPDRAASRATSIYVASTFGAIVGAIAGGFVFLRLFGVRGALIAAAIPGAIAAAWLVARAISTSGAPVTAAPAAGAGAGKRTGAHAVAFVAAAGLFCGLGPALLPRWDPAVLSAGTYTYAASLPDLDALTREQFLRQYREGGDDLILRFHREGLASTVTVEDYPKKNTRYLKNSGKVEASIPIDPSRPSLADMPTQVLLSALPLMVADRTDRVLVIGLGSGVTAGSALLFEGVRELECVELEAAVVEAVRDEGFFDAWNGKPFDDDRFRCVTGEDGRNHILLAERPYDVIVSQPSDPWLSGAANLFTREFFEAGHEALRDGGVFCQWIQLYSLEVESFRSLLATFASVFDDVHVFRPPGTQEVLVLGGKGPLRFHLKRLGERARSRRVQAALAAAGLRRPLDLLAIHLFGGDDVRAWVAGATINTDDNLHVEFAAPRSLYVGPDAARRIVEDVLARARVGLYPALADLPESAATRVDDARLLAESLARQGNVGGAIAVVEQLIADPRVGENANALRLLGDLEHLRGRHDDAVAAWRRALEADPDHVLAHISLATWHHRRGEDDEARALLDEAVKRNPNDEAARYFRGRFLLKLGEIAQAQIDLERAGSFRGADELSQQLARAIPGGTQAPQSSDGTDDGGESGEGGAAGTGGGGGSDEPMRLGDGAAPIEHLRKLGRRALRQGQLRLAKSALEEVLDRADTDDADARADLGAVLAHADAQDVEHRSQARALLEEAIAIDDDHRKARRALGELLYEERDLEGALVHLRRYLGLARSSATARTSILVADILKLLDQVDDAATELEKADELAPDFPPVLLNLGGIYVLQERADAARAVYLRWVDVAAADDPSRAAVERWLEEDARRRE